MNLFRSRLTVGLAAAFVVGAMLMPLTANAMPKFGMRMPGISAKVPVVPLGYGYYWTFVDYLRWWKGHHYID